MSHKPGGRHTLIQVYGPTTAATVEEMERFYQDLPQAVKQVPKGDMLLVKGDFNVDGWSLASTPQRMPGTHPPQ